MNLTDESRPDRGTLTSIEPLVERAIEETCDFVNARAVPDLTAAVMGQIEQIGPRQRRRPRNALVQLAGSLWTVRRVSFQFRPAYGLLMAAVLVVAVARFFVNPSIMSPASPQLFVQFRLEAIDASNVRLAGSFTGWQPRYELHPITPGIWTITIPLPAGVHDYAFVVDDKRWVPDPYAPAVNDGFGGTNSRLALVAPEHSRL